MPEGGSSGSKLGVLMRELDCAATANEKTAEAVIRYARDGSEPSGVAEALACMASNPSKGIQSGNAHALASAIGGLSIKDTVAGWNPNAFVDAVKSVNSSIDWLEVTEALDGAGLAVQDQASFRLLVTAMRRAGLQGLSLETVVYKQWDDVTAQLSLLKQAVAAPPDVFSFAASRNKVPPLEDNSGGGSPNEAWLSVDLLTTLSRLAKDNPGEVAVILEAGRAAAPAALLLSFAAAHAEWDPLQLEVRDSLAAEYVAGSNSNSKVVLTRLWKEEPEAVVGAMGLLLRRDPSAPVLSRILQLSKDVGSLPEVLHLAPHLLAIQLATAAACATASSPQSQLQPWLQKRLLDYGAPFLHSLLHFMSEKLSSKAVVVTLDETLPDRVTVKLPLAAVATIFRVLLDNASQMSDVAVDGLSHLRSQATTAFPTLAEMLPPEENSVVSSSGGGSSGGAGSQDVDDIERLANDFFQKLYSGELSVTELVATLARFCEGSPRERRVFQCMVHNLFDEYQFFTKYPDKELHTTAHLFGSLVRQKLVTEGPLATALRCIAEAARALPGSKLSNFAVGALTQFRDLLPALRDFCRTLSQSDNLRQASPELAEAVERVVQQEPSTAASSTAATAGDGGVGGGGGGPLRSGDGGVGDLLPDGLIAAEGHSQAVGEQTVAAGAVPLSQARAVAAFDMGMNASATPFTSGAGAGMSASHSVPAGGEAASRSALGMAGTHPGGASSVSASSLGLPSAAPTTARGLTFATINAETLEAAARDADFPVPGQDVIDQVHFVVNNLSTSNLESKSEALHGALQPVFWPWFSNYMVVKRAAQEPNFHSLYLTLLDKLGEDSGSSLGPTVVSTTHKYIRILLASPRIQTHASERSLLKNLGTWLGALTLARNQTLRHRDLNVKASICNAYKQGRMIAVLPFVGKILEATKDSKSYRPSNPWVMAIMSLLAEIYGLDRLKLNLKFEIEMVFRTLGLQISDVKASDLLSNRMRLVGSDNPDFAPDKIALKVGEASAPGQSPVVPRQHQPSPPDAPPTSSIPQDTISLPGPSNMDQGGLCANLGAFVNISPSLGMLSEQLQLKRMVPVAVDRAICEIITPVVERSCTIACKTTRELVAKDFACEPDEAAVREAAHAMVTCLAGSLALVTCKEPLRSALSSHLTQLLQAPQVDPSTIENAVATCTADNLDLGCRIIEKAAHDRAILDIDDRLAATYAARKSAKATGRSFFDVTVPQPGPGTTAASLPESLRPRRSPLSLQQSRLYADYGRIRTKEANEGDAEADGTGEGERGGESVGGGRGHDTTAAQLAAAQLQEMYTSWQRRLEEAVASEPQEEGRELAQDSPLRSLAGEVVAVVACATARNDAAIAVCRKVFGRLLEVGANRGAAAAYAAALAAVARMFPTLPAEVTALFVRTEDERKYQRTVGEALLREGLLGALQLDAHLASAIAANHAGGGTELAVHLLRAAAQDANPPLPATSLAATSQVLAELAVSTSGGAPLLALLQAAAAAAAGANSVNIVGGQAAQRGPSPAPGQLAPGQLAPRLQSMPSVGNASQPPGLREQVALVFDRWASISSEQPIEQAHPAFIAHLHHVGLIQGDEATENFLEVVVELAVAHCLASSPSTLTGPTSGIAVPLSFLAVDAAVRLLVLLIRRPDSGPPQLARALGVISKGLKHDSSVGGAEFNPRPYFRMCIGLMRELLPSPATAEDNSDDDLFATLNAFAAAFFEMQPLNVAGFAYCWLELISHRSFMPAVLSQKGNRGWGTFEVLLRGMLTFLEPYLRDSRLNISVRTLYKGVLRVLLVLLHDFPELLCEYHLGLCACVPTSCIQMRNLLLSAFPRAMRLPDPFTLGLKVDLLPEIQKSPRFTATPEALLAGQPELRKEVDRYITTRAPSSWLASLPGLLMLPPGEAAAAGTRYNTVLINSMSFYVGIKAMTHQGGEPGAAPPSTSPAMDIFGSLATELDTEGRYLFFNSLANQLRFPNSHTHYFSCTLLFLFAAAQQEVIQEQITRVLLERLIVNRPHPWGLLITFIELIKNPRYSFWTHAFTHCAPEIDRLFESVARSCMQSHDVPPDIPP